MSVIAAPRACPMCGKEFRDIDVCPDDGIPLLPPVTDPLLGQVLKGTYKIVERIAKGGMGVVYRAAQMPLGRSVAVKAVFTNPLTASEVAQRFFREARLLSQINHPNIVSLIDFGTTEDDVLFMVMEHLQGRTLDKIVPRDEGLSLGLTLDLMEQICAGVSVAHAHNMIHRDLKPSNIFLATLSGDVVAVKILDFGIAKVLDDEENLTQDGVLIGSSGSMSPEQIHGLPEIDGRSDIYSLGALLYFMLAGKPAFPGNSRAVMTRQMLERPAPIDFEALGKPEAAALMSVIYTAMEHEPQKRYQSAEELMQAIREACNLPEPSVGTHLRPEDLPNVVGDARSTVGPALRADTRSGSSPRPRSPSQTLRAQQQAEEPQSRGGMLVVAAIVLALAFAAGLYFLQKHGDNPSNKPNTGGDVAKKPRPRPTFRGVSEDEIILGMTAPNNGPSRELGRGMEVGLRTYFDQVNDDGGINGRRLKLVPLDDGYEPDRALANMKQLFEQHKAFAVVGNVGTPTAAATLPYALEKKMLFFGAFTGSKLLRKDPPDRFVFNYRASYPEETAAVVDYLIRVRKVPSDAIAVFAQQDNYGDAGFEGVVRAIRDHNGDPDNILRVGYARNTENVDDAVAEVVKNKQRIKAIIMVPTYRPAALFIKKVTDAGMRPIFSNVSFVGSDALAEELRQMGTRYAEGVIVTQVVPHPESHATGVLQYRERLQRYYPNERPSFVSLEGYIAAAILCDALQRTGDDLNTDTLIKALEATQGLDMGLGSPINFGMSEHQGSHKVWGTVLDKNCRYQVLELN
jgi:serine/threonine protein kinase